MQAAVPLIFRRPIWWYLASAFMLLVAGVPILVLAIASGDFDNRAARPFLILVGILLILGAVGFCGFRCRTVIDFAGEKVTYEWATFFVRHQEVYRLRDIHHVALRRANTASGPRTHHVFLATAKDGRPVRIELQEVVYHNEAVAVGKEVARVLGKTFIDQSGGFAETG